jgi:choice-of-anchor A domain-containing protein
LIKIDLIALARDLRVELPRNAKPRSRFDEEYSMRNAFTLSLGVALVVSAAGSAFAGTLTASTILQDFNAVVYQNASTQADIEGAAVIGGNFSGATMYNNPTSSVPTGFGALDVFGYTSGNSININNGGNAYVAGNEGATINFNGGGSYISAPPNTITDFETPLNALSQSLAQTAANSPTPTLGANNNNNIAFNAAPGSNGIAVFDITAAQLSNISSFLINLDGASTVVINVSGTSVSDYANDESGTTGANNIIWNFYQATSVTLGTQIGGTVLATGAAVTNDNQIDGALVAQSWNGNGELHDWGFDGVLPTTSQPQTAVPEPGSLALLCVGIAVLGIVRRRR